MLSMNISGYCYIVKTEYPCHISNTLNFNNGIDYFTAQLSKVFELGTTPCGLLIRRLKINHNWLQKQFFKKRNYVKTINTIGCIFNLKYVSLR